jgi:hypothetical protein
MKVHDHIVNHAAPSRRDMLASPIGVLLHSRGLGLFNRESVKLLTLGYKSFAYPDGTIEFDCGDDAGADRLFRALPVIAANHKTIYFRNLLGYPLRRYILVYAKTYFDRIEDAGLGLGAGVLDFFPGEWKRECLQFTITFRRRPSQRAVKELLHRFSSLFRATRRVGLDSEGPLLFAKKSIAIRGTRAEMYVDASRTGPRTLVWPLLEALNFGHDIIPVELAVYNQDDEVNIQMSLEGARTAYTVCNMPWTEQYEREFLERARGGLGEPTRTYPVDLDLSV